MQGNKSGGKWDLLLDFRVHELKATVGTVCLKSKV